MLLFINVTAAQGARYYICEMKGTIFNIQRYSLHDGPGIRTVVFFKGCPLSCRWCCNPESIDISPRITFDARKCLGDGRCVSACTTGARSKDGYRIECCIFCGRCVEACPSGALELLGRRMSVSEVLHEAEKDRPFYESSGGGVTLSGGELLMQREFALELLKELRSRYLHAAIETTGFAPWTHLEEIVDASDLVLYDLKLMDSTLHRMHTGVSNERILENALKIAEKGKALVFRVPLIGGINTDQENIEAVAQFSLKARVKELHLLPYHRLGESKYAKLGKVFACRAVTPGDETVGAIRKHLESYGLTVKIGG